MRYILLFQALLAVRGSMTCMEFLASTNPVTGRPYALEMIKASPLQTKTVIDLVITHCTAELNIQSLELPRRVQICADHFLRLTLSSPQIRNLLFDCFCEHAPALTMTYRLLDLLRQPSVSHFAKQIGQRCVERSLHSGIENIRFEQAINELRITPGKNLAQFLKSMDALHREPGGKVSRRPEHSVSKDKRERELEETVAVNNEDNQDEDHHSLYKSPTLFVSGDSLAGWGVDNPGIVLKSPSKIDNRFVVSGGFRSYDSVSQAPRDFDGLPASCQFPDIDLPDMSFDTGDKNLDFRPYEDEFANSTPGFGQALISDQHESGYGSTDGTRIDSYIENVYEIVTPSLQYRPTYHDHKAPKDLSRESDERQENQEEKRQWATERSRMELWRGTQEQDNKRSNPEMREPAVVVRASSEAYDDPNCLELLQSVAITDFQKGQLEADLANPLIESCKHMLTDLFGLLIVDRDSERLVALLARRSDSQVSRTMLGKIAHYGIARLKFISAFLLSPSTYHIAVNIAKVSVASGTATLDQILDKLSKSRIAPRDLSVFTEKVRTVEYQMVGSTPVLTLEPGIHFTGTVDEAACLNYLVENQGQLSFATSIAWLYDSLRTHKYANFHKGLVHACAYLFTYGPERTVIVPYTPFSLFLELTKQPSVISNLVFGLLFKARRERATALLSVLLEDPSKAFLVQRLREFAINSPVSTHLTNFRNILKEMVESAWAKNDRHHLELIKQYILHHPSLYEVLDLLALVDDLSESGAHSVTPRGSELRIASSVLEGPLRPDIGGRFDVPSGLRTYHGSRDAPTGFNGLAGNYALPDSVLPSMSVMPNQVDELERELTLSSHPSRSFSRDTEPTDRSSASEERRASAEGAEWQKKRSREDGSRETHEPHKRTNSMMREPAVVVRASAEASDDRDCLEYLLSVRISSFQKGQLQAYSANQLVGRCKHMLTDLFGLLPVDRDSERLVALLARNSDSPVSRAMLGEIAHHGIARPKFISAFLLSPSTCHIAVNIARVSVASGTATLDQILDKLSKSQIAPRDLIVFTEKVRTAETQMVGGTPVLTLEPGIHFTGSLDETARSVNEAVCSKYLLENKNQMSFANGKAWLYNKSDKYERFQQGLVNACAYLFTYPPDKTVIVPYTPFSLFLELTKQSSAISNIVFEILFEGHRGRAIPLLSVLLEDSSKAPLMQRMREFAINSPVSIHLINFRNILKEMAESAWAKNDRHHLELIEQYLV